MKKLIILSALVTLLSAEEPVNDSLDLLSLAKKTEEQIPALVESEELANNEIESFFEFDEGPAEFVLISPAEEVSQENLELPAAKELPDLTPKESITVKNEHIEIKAEAPILVEKSLDIPQLEIPSLNKEIAGTPMTEKELAELEAEVNGIDQKTPGIMIDLGQVFSGSPTIYTILLVLSVGSFCIWLYSLLNLRTKELLPRESLKNLREKLMNREYNNALALCQQNKTILFQMLASGIAARLHGQNVMLDTMKSEGKRASASLWQKIALLNDVAIIAPMLGLLGTVLGMFYAFYDLNRSMESISALFDGLGISVGTTLCGLIVAILAMIFHSMTKYRLVRQLTLVENEAVYLANLIDTKE